jgi:anthranilate phosphoribosyltransferase
LPRGDMADLVGGTPEDNAKILRGVLGGSLNGTRKNAVLLNAAAALAAESGDLREGFAVAKQALESGAALGKLEQLVEFSARA